LITGGAGFVGLNLVDYFFKTLSEQNTNMALLIVDNLSSGNLDLLNSIVERYGYELNGDRIKFYKMDIGDKEVENVLKESDYVIHLAAQTGVIPSMEDPVKDAEVNILGTLNLLNLSVKHKIKKFIFASSAAPLGEQKPPLNEEKIPNPLSPYGASKLSAEGYCKAYFGSFGLNTIILRFSNLYGIYSYHKGSVIAEFFRRIMKNKELIIYGDGKQTRDFLFAGDLSEFIFNLINNDYEFRGEVFQLGTGVETSINELVDMIKEVVKRDINIKFEPERKGEIKRNYTDISKVKKLLNYNPKTNLIYGLKKTYNWFKENI